VQSLDFSTALYEVKGGAKIARQGWNGKGLWVALSPGFKVGAERIFSEPIKRAVGDDLGVFRPYLMMRSVDGEFVPWIASQSDLLADDWEVVP